MSVATVLGAPFSVCGYGQPGCGTGSSAAIGAQSSQRFEPVVGVPISAQIRWLAEVFCPRFAARRFQSS